MRTRSSLVTGLDRTKGAGLSQMTALVHTASAVYESQVGFKVADGQNINLPQNEKRDLSRVDCGSGERRHVRRRCDPGKASLVMPEISAPALHGDNRQVGLPTL